MSYSIYIVQALSFLFAFALAKHDAPTVDMFESNGATNLQMARFHRYNVWVKFSFCVIAAMTGFGITGNLFLILLDMFIAGLLSFLWIYLLFDPMLNVGRERRKDWDYIGMNDADGRRWINWFGKNAGETKAVILLSLIIVVNGLIIIFM